MKTTPAESTSRRRYKRIVGLSHDNFYHELASPLYGEPTEVQVPLQRAGWRDTVDRLVTYFQHGYIVLGLLLISLL